MSRHDFLIFLLILVTGIILTWQILLFFKNKDKKNNNNTAFLSGDGEVAISEERPHEQRPRKERPRKERPRKEQSRKEQSQREHPGAINAAPIFLAKKLPDQDQANYQWTAEWRNDEEDRLDPCAQAEVYMAYGITTRAIEILKEAIARNNNPHAHLMIIELYKIELKNNPDMQNLIKQHQEAIQAAGEKEMIKANLKREELKIETPWYQPSIYRKGELNSTSNMPPLYDQPSDHSAINNTPNSILFNSNNNATATTTFKGQFFGQ